MSNVEWLDNTNRTIGRKANRTREVLPTSISQAGGQKQKTKIEPLNTKPMERVVPAGRKLAKKARKKIYQFSKCITKKLFP